jgi:hypothetical protein
MARSTNDERKTRKRPRPFSQARLDALLAALGLVHDADRPQIRPVRP